MTLDRALLYLRDMREHAKIAVELLGESELEQFEENRMMHLAVIRCVEVVGEACKAVPPHIRERAPDIPWRSIARMRDLLIHHYFGVKLEAVYKVAREDAPILIQNLDALLDSLADVTD